MKAYILKLEVEERNKSCQNLNYLQFDDLV